MLLFTDNFIFAKYWYVPFFIKYTGHKVSLLPGKNPGISGSIVVLIV